VNFNFFYKFRNFADWGKRSRDLKIRNFDKLKKKSFLKIEIFLKNVPRHGGKSRDF